MRELINCIAATAAWMEFCTANRIVDTPTSRKTHFGHIAVRGDSYTIARCLAMTLELAVSEKLRRERPRITLFNGRA